MAQLQVHLELRHASTRGRTRNVCFDPGGSRSSGARRSPMAHGVRIVGVPTLSGRSAADGGAGHAGYRGVPWLQKRDRLLILPRMKVWGFQEASL